MNIKVIRVPSPELGVELQKLIRLVNSKVITSREIRLFAAEFKDFEGDFTLKVDYTETVFEMVAAGKYDFANERINDKNFPRPAEKIGQREEVSARLFNFNRVLDSEQVIARMAKKGFRPGTSTELLSFGMRKPRLQRYFPIAALGSIWENAYGDDIIWLCQENDSRILDRRWFNEQFVHFVRFLGVRE